VEELPEFVGIVGSGKTAAETNDGDRIFVELVWFKILVRLFRELLCVGQVARQRFDAWIIIGERRL
jgi:hypothetical protein